MPSTPAVPLPTSNTMVFYTKRTSVKFALQSSAETTIATTSTSTVPAFDVSLAPEVSFTERAAHGASLGRLVPMVGQSYATLSFSTEISCSGVSGQYPKWAPLLQGCGMTNTTFTESLVGNCAPIDAAPGLSGGTPGSTEQGCLSFDVHIDGRRYQIQNSMGNFSISGAVGEVPRINWEFQGKLVSQTAWATATTYPATNTYDAVQPCLFLGANTVKLRKYTDTVASAYEAPYVTSYEFDAGNSVGFVSSANASDGYAHAVITERAPTITFDVEMSNAAADVGNHVNEMMSPATGAEAHYYESNLLVKNYDASDEGNGFNLRAMNGILTGVELQDRDGIRAESLSFALAENQTANPDSTDSYTISFTDES